MPDDNRSKRDDRDDNRESRQSSGRDSGRDSSTNQERDEMGRFESESDSSSSHTGGSSKKK
jgi:hypothetical protein